jgi:predicted nicotinamide N-methyase
MLQRWEDPAQPPLVLDVGAGSGLLSMLAAQAGAPAVIGECSTPCRVWDKVWRSHAEA